MLACVRILFELGAAETWLSWKCLFLSWKNKERKQDFRREDGGNNLVVLDLAGGGEMEKAFQIYYPHLQHL